MGRYSDTNASRFEKKYIGQLDRKKGEHNGNGQKAQVQNGAGGGEGTDFSRTYDPGSSVWQQRPRPGKVDEGLVGIVERQKDFRSPDRRLVAGYLIAKERDSNRVYVYLSKQHGFCGFKLSDGTLITAPDADDAKGLLFRFHNYPDPIYHRSFRSDARGDRTFESHCTSVIKGRMAEVAATGGNASAYEGNMKIFLQEAAEMFRKAGKY